MNEKKLTIKDSSLAFLIGFLMCQLSVVVISVIATIVFAVLNKDMSSFTSSAVGYLITSFSLYFTMFLLFLFFNKGKDNHITQNTKPLKILLYCAIAILSFLCLYPIIASFDTLLIKLNITINALPYKLTTNNYLISLLSLVLFPAVCEELLFRGIIFSGLKKHGKAFSIIVSSVMFSIYHMAISQTIYPLLMGLLFGVIMFYENNIYYCITVHLTNNFLSLTLSYFKQSLVFNHWSYFIMAGVLCLLFLSTILYFAIRKNKETKNKLNSNDKLFLFSTLAIMLLLWILVNFS